MEGYYPRLIEKEIETKLNTSGAVLVTGPKFCGKTTTCSMFQKSAIKLNTKQAINLARLNPAGVLMGEKPRLIDEWQTVPDIWNQVKSDLDDEYEFGKYILTGSSTPVDQSEIYHSGVGRIAPVRMRTMSLYESKESKGIVSLSKLFEKPDSVVFDMNEELGLEDIAFMLCRGGWPIAVKQSNRKLALQITKNYYDGLFVFDGSDNERFRNKKPETLKSIVRSYARNISSEAPATTIINDIAMPADRKLDRKTYDDYVEALRDLYIIEDIPAWNPNIRSKTSVRSTPTRHFIDTSIACRALNIFPSDLLNDLNSFGFFFEDMAVRDLSIYMKVFGGEVRHYRDNTGLECDAILHMPDGQWAAVEIKLGGEALVKDGIESLKRLKNKILTKSEEKAPCFMMVLTAIGPAYQIMEDGIYVVPINCLKP